MIYLDNAATTCPDEESVQSALKYLKNEFFNPSALYREGFAVHKELDNARKNILSHIASPNDFELIFTGSGSEADNQAYFSAVTRGNVVTTLGEHAAGYNSAKELALRGREVRFAKLNKDGSVDMDHLLSLIDADTSFVSVIHVNNETGAINPISEIAKELKKIKSSIVFHSDGVQAFGKIPFKLDRNIDLYTISAHKIGGIRGVAGLIKRKGLNVRPLIFGGGQEGGLRSGTENTFAIKQFEYAAAQKYKSLAEDFEKVRGFNTAFREGLNGNIFEILSSENASPYILSISAKGLRGEVLLHMINDAGVLIGTGSACSSKHRYSRVMLACGLDETRADGVLRISFSVHNTEEEIKTAIAIINGCAESLAERMR